MPPEPTTQPSPDETATEPRTATPAQDTAVGTESPSTAESAAATAASTTDSAPTAESEPDPDAPQSESDPEPAAGTDDKSARRDSDRAENSAGDREEGVTEPIKAGKSGGDRREGQYARRRGKDRAAARTVSVSLTAIGVAAGAVVLTAAVAVCGYGWWSAREEIAQIRSDAYGERHAEQVATDYAVGASTIDHQNIPAWVDKLKANTSPPLAHKIDATAPKLEQILLPLQWTSTAVPIAAKVATVSGGVYKVNVFVDVTSTNAQNLKGGQMTVTYNVTVDSNSGWQITDVGGLDGALPTR
ncbi:hypothetical protein [Nocardia sputorum]|uniref:Mce-associated membrane protein n=1 Tax=Nocardia sputorum TaxID=2984338 RepID=A0ABM8CWD3_9NOCA|nr:hypothetical protein [Nocardia sputorum]BDT99294.1 hypothetical protein IFM12276_23230 [Nocardia sputorum]